MIQLAMVIGVSLSSLICNIVLLILDVSGYVGGGFRGFCLEGRRGLAS